MMGLLAALKYLCLWENIGWYLTDMLEHLQKIINGNYIRK